ncbi:MAG: two-component system, OmpR family, response regulator MprA [Candidatus Eremiobacteraeota bacterium]|jgi:two-component system response regulator MprA|nr:two-component system, OmpR family, response regulator MprA [Candidatus Eremiobacteraeota bacterium]
MMTNALPSSRVLVVDDERAIREMLEISLEHRGFEVRSTADGVAALAETRAWRPDAILLDVMLPKMDGITLLAELRRITEAPILMVSARNELADRVAGLERGADDYISKPFEMVELLARIDRSLSRPHLNHPEVISYADVEVEIKTRTVRRAGRVVDFSALEYDLFVLLIRHPRRVFTRDHLLDLVWGADSTVGRSSPERYISYVRQKIDRGFSTPLIHTVRGVGYSLHDRRP